MSPGSPLSSPPDSALRELLAHGRFQDALDAYRALGDSAVRQRPETQLLAATAATRIGDLVTGITLAESSLERFRSRTDADGRMRAANLLGVIAFEQGRLVEAEHFFDQALQIARGLGDSLVAARASNNLGSLADLRGMPDLALRLFRSALVSYQRLGNRRGTAETYHNLGVVFRHLGAWHEAEEATASAIRHAETLEDESLLAIAVMGRAELYLDRGDLELVRPALHRARQLAGEAMDEIGIAEVGRLGALLAFAEHDYAAAAREAEAAYASAQRLGTALLQAECAAAAARAFRALGQHAEAGTMHAEALRIFESLGAAKWIEMLNGWWESDGVGEG